jgi:signal recognition particle receptor subunit beta
MVLNIVVAGPLNAGKNTFIRSCCRGSIQSKRPRVPTHGFGELIIDRDHLIHLYEAAPLDKQELWAVQTTFMHGFVVVVDLTKPDTFVTMPIFIQEFTKLNPVPYVIAANRYDASGASTIESLRDVLVDADSTKIIACNVTNYEAAKEVLLQLIVTILESLPESKNNE